MESNNKIRIFVYGTLRRGFGLNPFLKTGYCKGEGFVYGTMYNLGSFPGVILDETKTKKVVGEIYFIDRETLDKLDHIEGYIPDEPEHSLYIRKPVIVLDSNNEEEFGYIYEYNQRSEIKQLRIIESGDWAVEEKELRESFLKLKLS